MSESGAGRLAVAPNSMIVAIQRCLWQSGCASNVFVADSCGKSKPRRAGIRPSDVTNPIPNWPPSSRLGMICRT
jgi:hypothetical protein